MLTARRLAVGVIAPAPASARSSSAAVRWAQPTSGSQRAAGLGLAVGLDLHAQRALEVHQLPAAAAHRVLDQRGAPGRQGLVQPAPPAALAEACQGGAGVRRPSPRRNGALCASARAARGRPRPSARPGRGAVAPSRPHRRPPPPVCRRPAAPPAVRRTRARGLLGHAAHGQADREVRAVEAADEAAVGARRVGLQRLGDGGDHAVGAVMADAAVQLGQIEDAAAPGRPRRCRPSRCRAASSWPMKWARLDRPVSASQLAWRRSVSTCVACPRTPA